jgi:TonB family protein
VGVKVAVDKSGNVTGAEFSSAGPSKYFANLALEAARKWKFAPAQKDARSADLHFTFKRSGTSASSSTLR